MIFKLLSVLCLVFLYRKILEAIYTRKLRRKFVFWQFLTLLDLLLFAIVLIWLISERVWVISRIPASYSGERRALEFLMQIDNMREFNFTDCTAFILSIMWIRVAMLFRITKLLGPLIKIIFALMRTFMLFFILYLLSLFSFSSVGILLFLEMDQFSSLYKAMIFLFGSSLGEFDFSVFDAITLDYKEYGHAFYVFFLIVNLVLLLNLLIAILSKTYAILEPKR